MALLRRTGFAGRPGLDGGLDPHGSSFLGAGPGFDPGVRLHASGSRAACGRYHPPLTPALMPVLTFMAAPFWVGGFDATGPTRFAPCGLVPGVVLHGHLLRGRRGARSSFDAGLDLHGSSFPRLWCGPGQRWPQQGRLTQLPAVPLSKKLVAGRGKPCYHEPAAYARGRRKGPQPEHRDS
jgi:hypothetical protein